MANLNDKSLSEYCAEAQRLVERRSLDAAIAIGQHILRHHPKYVNAYRVLAKATLEQGEVGYAADLFKRVLSADPEDLESRVGLGIIYTDEEALEEALWQWERAFELAPGNPDIRTQLRLVRESLEGAEFSRIELTRGALGRLYARGGLFQQATDEFQAVLNKDSDRVDIQIALAETLWRDGKLAAAEAMCEQILEALPNCLKANLILGHIWLRTGREEESHKSFRAAHALDPENRIASELLGEESPLAVEPIFVPRLEEVPPEVPKPTDLIAVEDEQLAGEPAMEGEEAELPDWLTQLRGAGVEEEIAADEALPDWLTSPELAEAEEEAVSMTLAEPPMPEPEPEPELEEFEEGELPDWLAELGVQEDEEAEEPLAAPLFEAEEPAADETIDQDVPEWLHKVSAEVEEDLSELEEVSTSFGPPETGADEFASREAPDWLQEIGEEGVEPLEALSEEEILASDTEPGEVPDWLSALEVEEAAEPEAADIAAWPEEAEPTEEAPDWLTALQAEEPTEPETAEPEVDEADRWREIMREEGLADMIEAAPVEPEELPEEVEAADEMPDWLTALQAEEAAEPEAVEPAPELEVPEAEPGEEVPDWLAALEAEEPLEPEAAEPAIEPEAADIAELLEEAEPAEEIPDWLAALRPEEPIEPAAAEAAAGPELDEADRWREIMREEGLADMIEAVPAEPEELPEEVEAADEMPDWLAALQAEEAAEPEVVEPAPEPEVPEAEPGEEAPDWLTALQAEEPTEPEAVKPEVGEADRWREIMREEGLADMIEAVPAEPEELPEEVEAADEMPDWLAALQVEEAAEPEVVEPAAEPEVPEAEPGEEVPDWLAALEVEEPLEPEAAEPAVEPEAADIAEWPEEAEPAAEMPDWLAALQAEEAAEPEAVEPAPEPELDEADRWREIMREEGLADMIEAAPAEPEELPEEAEPQPDEAELAEEIPDWLAALQAQEPTEVEIIELPPEPESVAVVEPSEEQEAGEEIPDWLAALQPEEREAPSEEERVAEPPSEAEVETVKEVKPAPEKEGVPDWLTGWQEEAEPGAVEAEIAEDVSVAELVTPEEEIAEEEEEAVSFLVSSYLARLEANPKDHEVRLALARAYRDERRLTAAFKQFQTLVASGHQVKELIPDLERLCASQAEDAKWHQLLGDAYTRVNQLNDALKAYRAAQNALTHQ